MRAVMLQTWSPFRNPLNQFSNYCGLACFRKNKNQRLRRTTITCSFAFGPNSAGLFNMFASKAPDRTTAWYGDLSDHHFIRAHLYGMPMKRASLRLPDGTYRPDRLQYYRHGDCYSKGHGRSYADCGVYCKGHGRVYADGERWVSTDAAV